MFRLRSSSERREGNFAPFLFQGAVESYDGTKKGGPIGTALFHCVLVKRYAAWGSAAFACAMIVANTPPSFIARSAMTFRSSSIPASFTPCMNCE